MKRYLISGMLIAAAMQAKGQDVHFSQFYETNILRNPALTGIFSADYRVGALYRNQWSSISQPFRTGLVDAEMRVPVSGESGDFFAIGVLAYYDKAGSIDFNTTGVYPAVSFNKILSAKRQAAIAVGFTGGYLQRSFDPSKMTFNNQFQNGQYNPGNGSGEQITDSKLNNWDFGGGVVFHSSAGGWDQYRYFLGVSGYHFSRPSTSFYNNNLLRMDMKLNGSGGVTLKLDETYNVQVQANYTMQGSYSEAIAGAMVGWKRQAFRDDEPLLALYGGAFYRLKDAVIPTVKIEYKRMALNMSYDVNISRLRAASNAHGGFEMSLFFSGLFRDPRYEMSRTLCPSFW